MAPAIATASIFGVLTLVHLIQGLWYRKPFTWTVIMAASWEMGAFILLAYGSKDQQQVGYATGHQVLFLLAPIWLNAFVYMTFARMVYFFRPGGEPRIAHLPARWLGRIFVVADIGTFIVQATGGIMDGPTVDLVTRTKGVRIYIIGMAVQEGFIFVFLMLMARFHYRCIQMDRDNVYGLEDVYENEDGYVPRRNWKALQFALYAALLAITTRIIFRLVEFTGGMTPEENPIPFTEAYSYALDAFPMMLALLILGIIHPGRVLQGPNSDFPRKGCREKRKEKKEKKQAKRAANEEKKRIEEERKKRKTYGQVPETDRHSYEMGLIDGNSHEPMRHA
ncbi:putative lipid transporter atnI [Colletotrichum liriopes]|uniref:Lipid transporter atnI n=1 Tax=Colletotrichum liriopes TaxID=708192 RepID=A0AA37LVU0_9PEZI|nr:putative lipid transporter atnI [Colletotrichum liriopes]